jgi:HEAT repeat protein
MKKRKVLIILLIFAVIIIMAITVVVPMQKNKSDIKNAIDRLHSSDPIVRAYAAEELGHKGSKAASAIPFLIELLYDDTPLQWKLPNFPSSIPGPQTSPAERAVFALQNIGEVAIESLLTTLNNNASKTSKLAAKAFREISCSRAVEPLINLLKDNDRDTRIIAIDALVKQKDFRAVEPLISVLKSKGEDPFIITIVIGALVEFKDPRAVKPMVDLLKDENYTDADYFNRSYIIRALGKLRNPHAIEPLINALQYGKSFEREDAAAALDTITGQHFGQNINAWQEWWSKNKKN